MATFYMTIRGDQLGSFTTLSGTGNGAERVVTLGGTSAYGTAEQIFTIRIDQAAEDATQFANGQFITIYDSLGNVVLAQTGVQPDIEQGLGAGDEHLILPGAGLFIELGGVTEGTAVFAAADEPASGDLGDNDGELDFADTRTTFPCFATGTRIDCPGGPRPVETLCPGDLVRTLDHGDMPIRWIRGRRVVFGVRGHPQQPILFRRGSLGAGLPRQPLAVSPQHRMAVEGAGGARFLVAAKALLGQPGVRAMQGCRTVTYWALLLDRHSLLAAEGATAESFYPGPHILRQLPAFHRLEVLAHLHALGGTGPGGYGPSALPILTPAQARLLLTAQPQDATRTPAAARAA